MRSPTSSSPAARASRSPATASEALDPGRSHDGTRPIDLVLMDVMMPVMDGLDRDARDPQEIRTGKAADHRPDRQSDARRSAELPRRRRQRLHGQAARRRKAPLAGARVDAAMNGDEWRQDRGNRNSPAAGGALSEVPLRLPQLCAGVDQAAAAAGAAKIWGSRRISAMQDGVLHDPAMLPATPRLSDRPGQRDVSRSRPISAPFARRWCRICAPIPRSRSGSPAAAAARSSIPSSSCSARRGSRAARCSTPPTSTRTRSPGPPLASMARLLRRRRGSRLCR